MPPPLEAGLEETGAVSSPPRADVKSVAAVLGPHVLQHVGRHLHTGDDHQVTTAALQRVDASNFERFCNGDVYLVMHVVHGAFGADPGGTNGNATGSLNTVTRTFCRVGPKASMGKGTVACIKVMELRKALPGPCSIRRGGDETQKSPNVLVLFDEVKAKEEESRAQVSNKSVMKVKAWNEQPPFIYLVRMRPPTKMDETADDSDGDRGMTTNSPHPVSPRRPLRSSSTVIKRAQEPLGMLQHAARPIGATVKPGPAVVKVPIETVTWAHDESLGGISVLETGQGVLVGGGASAGMPRAALVHLIAVCKPKQHQEGTRSLSPAVYAKNRDVALRPVDGDQWWDETDHPWGCLVALDSRDAAHHLAGLPAHQDGSAKAASARLRKLRWLLPLLCVAALIGAVGGQDVDAASVPSLGLNASYLESEWELETFFASFQNEISDSGEHVRENREFDRLLEEQSRRDAETADGPLEAWTPMTAGDVREPPQSTASWASPVFLLLSVGVVLWALVSGQGRAASAKLKALAARAPATIGTWLKRNKSDADDTERVRIAELEEKLRRAEQDLGKAEVSARETAAAQTVASKEAVHARQAMETMNQAAVAEAEASAAAAQQETEQAKEAAATERAELGAAQQALHETRQELEKTWQVKVTAEDSLAEVTRIAAEERAEMVSRVAEVELQKAKGCKALEDQTARAVSAEGKAGELRAALENARREGEAREVAAAGARAEMTELQRQLDSALTVKRLDGAEKALETKKSETCAALAELEAARRDAARAAEAASQEAASQKEARRAEARVALEKSEARSAAAIAEATATAKVATERAEQAEQAAAAALHESGESSAAAVTAMAAAKSEADGKAAADAAAAKVTSAELARVEEKAAALRREVSVAESAIAEMDDARVKADKEKGLLRARIAALEKDGASASENAEAGRKAVADLREKVKAEQEKGRERVAQQEREMEKLRDMLSQATKDHAAHQAATSAHERTVAALANAREEVNSLRAKLEALENRSKQQHADKQRAEQQQLSKPPPGLVQASRSVQASPSPSTSPAAYPATGPLKAASTIPARSVSIDHKAGESEACESAERAKRGGESVEKTRGGSDAGGLPFHGRNSGGGGFETGE